MEKRFRKLTLECKFMFQNMFSKTLLDFESEVIFVFSNRDQVCASKIDRVQEVFANMEKCIF